MNTKQQIAKAWSEGWTVREIARLMGVSMRYVLYIRAELGLKNRARGRRKA